MKTKNLTISLSDIQDVNANVYNLSDSYLLGQSRQKLTLDVSMKTILVIKDKTIAYEGDFYYPSLDWTFSKDERHLFRKDEQNNWYWAEVL